MKIFSSLLFLIFYSPFLFAGNTKDSLDKIAWEIKVDSSRLNRLIEWGLHYESSDYALTLDIADDAIALAQKTMNKKQEAFALNLKGNVYWMISEYDKSMKYYLEALRIREEIKDARGQGATMTNIASLLMIQEDYEKAGSYLDRALELFLQIKDKKEEAALYSYRGEFYMYQDSLEQAEFWFKKAIDLSRNTGDHAVLSQANNGLAIIKKKNGAFSDAERLYEENVIIDSLMNNKYGMSVSMNNLSLLYAKTGKTDKAIKIALRSAALAEETGSLTSLKHAFRNLATFYNEKGHHKNAYEMMLNYAGVSAAITQEDRLRATKEMEARFNDEKRMLEIKNLQSEKNAQAIQIALKDEEARSLRNQRIFFLSGIGFLIVIAAFIYYMLHQNKKSKKQIEIRNHEIELQKKIVEEKNHEIVSSISYAKRLQDAILPPKKLVKEYLSESFILYKPKDIVAGDFYWMHSGEGEDALLFAAADCTGHGVPGAMVSVVCSNALNRSVKEFRLKEPGKILDKVCDLVEDTFSKSEESVRDGMDISLCRLNTATRKLSWSGANNPLWVVRNRELLEYRPDKQPIGKYELRQPFTTHEIDLKKGDSIYIFSDGFADQFGGQAGKKFKQSQMKELLLSIQDLSMEEQNAKLEIVFENWRGTLEQIDDVCMIGVKV